MGRVADPVAEEVIAGRAEHADEGIEEPLSADLMARIRELLSDGRILLPLNEARVVDDLGNIHDELGRFSHKNGFDYAGAATGLAAKNVHLPDPALLDPALRPVVVEAAAAFRDRFPAVPLLVKVEVSSEPNFQAESQGFLVRLNPEWFGPGGKDRFVGAEAADRAAGWSAEPTPRGVMEHEFGHVIDWMTYFEASKIFGTRLTADSDTGSGRRGPEERFAEAFSQLYIRDPDQWSSDAVTLSRLLNEPGLAGAYIDKKPVLRVVDALGNIHDELGRFSRKNGAAEVPGSFTTIVAAEDWIRASFPNAKVSFGRDFRPVGARGRYTRQPLVSTPDIEAVNEVTRGLALALEKFPVLRTELNGVFISDPASNNIPLSWYAWAERGPGHGTALHLSSNWMTNWNYAVYADEQSDALMLHDSIPVASPSEWDTAYSRTKEALEKDLASGWHPQGTDGWDDIVMHEVGHAMFNRIDRVLRHEEPHVPSEWANFKNALTGTMSWRFPDRRMDAIPYASDYAKHSVKEAFSELFAKTFQTGGDPSGEDSGALLKVLTTERNAPVVSERSVRVVDAHGNIHDPHTGEFTHKDGGAAAILAEEPGNFTTISNAAYWCRKTFPRAVVYLDFAETEEGGYERDPRTATPDIEAINQITRGLRLMADRFPVLRDELTRIGVTDTYRGIPGVDDEDGRIVYAWVRGNQEMGNWGSELEFSANWLTNFVGDFPEGQAAKWSENPDAAIATYPTAISRLEKSLAEDVATGWHPAGMVDWVGMTIHEMGHALSNSIDRALYSADRGAAPGWEPPEADSEFIAWSEFTDAVDPTGGSIPPVSDYARKNADEAFAELVAATYTPGSPVVRGVADLDYLLRVALRPALRGEVSRLVSWVDTGRRVVDAYGNIHDPHTGEFTHKDVGAGNLRACKTLADLSAYVGTRYGYADFTGIPEEDLPVLRDCVAEIDRLTAKFPNTLVNQSSESGRTWMFTGIGTTSSPECPRNVKELMGDAWGATKGLSQHGGPRIWLNTASPEIFRDGTGMMGQIGFTLERTSQEAMVHEFGHVVHETERHALANAREAFWSVYGDASKPMRQLGRDLGIYAMGTEEERYATFFSALNSPGLIDRLPTEAARNRVHKVQRLTNQWGVDGL